jgi:hypothetical protein
MIWPGVHGVKSCPVRLDSQLKSAAGWQQRLQADLMLWWLLHRKHKQLHYPLCLQECYTASLEASATCLGYANRAMARLKLGHAAAAEADATAAIDMDPLYVKAYQRRATARKLLGRCRTTSSAWQTTTVRWPVCTRGHQPDGGRA